MPRGYLPNPDMFSNICLSLPTEIEWRPRSASIKSGHRDLVREKYPDQTKAGMEGWTVGIGSPFHPITFLLFLPGFAVIFRTNIFPLDEENMLPYDHFNAKDIIELKGVCLLPFTRARPRPRVVSLRT